MKILPFSAAVLLGCGLLSSAGCATKSQSQVSAAAATPAPSPAPASDGRTASPFPADSVPGIAQREVIRRRERLHQIDEAALRAHQSMAEGDLERAVHGYRTALDGLPASP